MTPSAYTPDRGDLVWTDFDPTSVVWPSRLPIAGEILTSHIRSIDTLARPIRYAGVAISDDIARLVRAKHDTFITILRA